MFELGAMLAEGERFKPGPHLTSVDVDLGRLRAERIRQGSFGDGLNISQPSSSPTVPWRFRTERALEGEIALNRPLERFPYVPSDPASA